MVAISRVKLRSKRANHLNPCLLAVVVFNGIIVFYLTVSSFWYESTDEDTRDTWKPSTPSSSYESNNYFSSASSVDFIPFENIPEREDAYAGGWWQTSERFLKMDLDPIDDRVHPSFDAWIDGRDRELRLTTD